MTIVSSVGGEAYTLATDGVGVVTTVAGSVFTVATGEFGEATSQIGCVLYFAYSSCRTDWFTFDTVIPTPPYQSE